MLPLQNILPRKISPLGVCYKKAVQFRQKQALLRSWEIIVKLQKKWTERELPIDENGVKTMQSTAEHQDQKISQSYQSRL